MDKKVFGMVTNYKNLTPQNDWLWQQTPHFFGTWGETQMLSQTPNPDFLLVYNFGADFFIPPAAPKNWLTAFKPQPAPPDITTRLRGVPKERIVALIREPPFEERLEIRKQDYQVAEQFCGYVSGPDDLAPVPDYMPAIWYHANSFRELNEMPPPEKVRPCSWITSGIDRTANHQKRLSFLKLLKNSDVDFDLFGRNLPDWAGGYGRIGNKWYTMAPYRYNLAIENYADNDWYVSEKLWDALLAWCLPIYYGGPAADKLLPPGSFLRLPSLDEKGLAYIQEVISSPDAWYQAKDAIAEARQIILHQLNLLNWLSDFTAKFD
ncbi:MAG: glycosyltransferase [Scytolyngbya sp. HA4215-MV1]|jgi:hypothetical protein|nr:glycosyltransferase [Scytolyngbya sp. HA4215-MV1]